MSRSAPRPTRPSLHGDGRAPAVPGQVVRAASPRDIVAAVPYQCGFHPARSVVVISLRGARRRFGMVCRLDLPDEPARSQAAREVVSFVARDQGTAALVLVYDEAEWDARRPPQAPFVADLLAGLERSGIPALDALFVTKQRYWSYLCRDEGCCPPEGSAVEDANSSPVAAAYVMAGLAPLESREALAARVTPTSPLLVAAVEDATWRRLTAGPKAQPGEPLRRRTADTFRLMAALVELYRDGAGELDVQQAAQLLAALQDRDVRDAVLLGFCCYGMAPPEDLGPLLEIGFLPELAAVDNTAAVPIGGPSDARGATEEAVERLLVDLCRRVDGPMGSAPLTLLAWHSWARGYGALARVAVERALGHDPTYRLAELLLAALDNGLAPEWVATSRAADEA
jgi:hypothetical protein